MNHGRLWPRGSGDRAHPGPAAGCPRAATPTRISALSDRENPMSRRLVQSSPGPWRQRSIREPALRSHSIRRNTNMTAGGGTIAAYGLVHQYMITIERFLRHCAFDMNSGPLSSRSTPGVGHPGRRTSCRAPRSTFSAVMDRSTMVRTERRVCSSISEAISTALPSMVESN